jgi:type I site-specific restriction endonuclease
MLFSVSALAEGFDEPTVNALVLIRPTKSRSLYKQIIGRGLRIAPDKDKCLILDCADVITKIGYPTDEVKPVKHRKFKQNKCKICNTDTQEISRKVIKNDNQVITIITHRCQNNHQFETESEINPPACESCNYVFKKGCDFKEIDNQYIIYHLCPQCNTEKIIRTLDKMNFDKFIKIESQTKSTFELINKIKKYTPPELEENMQKFVNYIMNKIHKDNQHHVITNLYQTVAKTQDLDIIKQNIRKSLVESALRTNKYDNVGSELLGICLSKTQDINNIICIYNSRAKNPMAERWLNSTLTKINQFILKYPEQKQYIVKSITTRCKNIMSSNNKMASLYYFPEFLEKQINNQESIDNTKNDAILISKLFNKK